MRTLVATLTISVLLLTAPAAVLAGHRGRNETAWVTNLHRDQAEARLQAPSSRWAAQSLAIVRDLPADTAPRWTEQQGRFGFKHQYVFTHRDDFQDRTRYLFTSPNSIYASPVPEPSGLTVLACPLAGYLLYWRRRRAVS